MFSERLANLGKLDLGQVFGPDHIAADCLAQLSMHYLVPFRAIT